MQLAFYKAPGTWMDKAVRLFTGSDYSHVELVINGTCCSASIRDGGVRVKQIDLASGNWDVIDIQGDEAKAWEWFADHLGEKYDWLGVWRFAVPFLSHRGNQWFCSEAVAAALGLDEPEVYNPGMLAEEYGIAK